MRIELVGSPGCGKTTLARAFMDLGVNTCFESVLKNPYLEKSYSDDSYRFPAQLQFALMKFDDYEKHKGAPLTVYDQGIATSLAFNSSIVDVLERMVADNAFVALENRYEEAEFVINVTCDAPEQLKRIHSRGRGFETLTAEKLHDITEQVSMFASEYDNVTTVNTTNWGFSDYSAFAFEFLLKHRLDTLCNLAKKVV